MGWIIAIVLIVFLVSYMAGQAGRASDAAKGRRNCRFCGARLRRASAGSGRLGYADTCSRCGRSQPWAKAAA